MAVASLPPLLLPLLLLFGPGSSGAPNCVVKKSSKTSPFEGITKALLREQSTSIVAKPDVVHWFTVNAEQVLLWKQDKNAVSIWINDVYLADTPINWTKTPNLLLNMDRRKSSLPSNLRDKYTFFGVKGVNASVNLFVADGSDSTISYIATNDMEEAFRKGQEYWCNETVEKTDKTETHQSQTEETSANSAEKKTKPNNYTTIGIIAGAVAGFVLLLVVIFLAAFTYKKKCSKKRKPQSRHIRNADPCLTGVTPTEVGTAVSASTPTPTPSRKKEKAPLSRFANLDADTDWTNTSVSSAAPSASQVAADPKLAHLNPHTVEYLAAKEGGTLPPRRSGTVDDEELANKLIDH